MDDTAQPIRGSYLADLDTILNSQDISNRRIVFKQITLSLLRVLYTFNTNEETIRFLTEAFDKKAEYLTPNFSLYFFSSFRTTKLKFRMLVASLIYSIIIDPRFGWI